MHEAETLRSEIADFKVNNEKNDEKIAMLKNELTRVNKLLKNVEQREFILKQQLEGISDVVEEEKKFLNNEIEDLHNKNKELEEQVESLNEELDNLKMSQKRRLTQDGGLNGLLKELNKDDPNSDALETAESDDNTGRTRSSSVIKSKDHMLQLLNKHIEDKKDPKKQEELAKKKEENDAAAIKVEELEKKIAGMGKMISTFQTNIVEEKKKNDLTKKQLEIKDKEMDALRDKLLQTTLTYSDLMNEINEQLESSYEVNRKLKRQLRNYGQ